MMGSSLFRSKVIDCFYSSVYLYSIYKKIILSVAIAEAEIWDALLLSCWNRESFNFRCVIGDIHYYRQPGLAFRYSNTSTCTLYTGVLLVSDISDKNLLLYFI